MTLDKYQKPKEINDSQIKIINDSHIKTQYGDVYFQDCRDSFKNIPNNTFDLCVTGFPYPNNGTHKPIKRQQFTYKYDVMKMNKEEYINYITDCWKSMKHIAKVFVIQCGFNWMKYWHQIDNFDPWFWYNTNKNGGCIASYGSRLEPFLLYNIQSLKQKDRFDVNPYEYDYPKEKYDFKYLKHPHPTASEIIKYIIESIKPKKVIDPYLGSGTTAQVCEDIGINFQAYEIQPEFKEDIIKRINLGIERHKRIININEVPITYKMDMDTCLNRLHNIHK